MLQLVLSDDGWLAAVSGRTAPVTDLRGEPGQRCQTRRTVLGYLCALITQITRQLAIAIEPPSLPDQFGLTRILQRTVA